MLTRRAPVVLLTVALLAAGGAYALDRDWTRALEERSDEPAGREPARPQRSEDPRREAVGRRGARAKRGGDHAGGGLGTNNRGPSPSEARAPRSPPFTPADDAHREALAHAPIASVRKSGAGRSLAFKITLEDGTVGYYKPEQTFSGTNWHAEVASYYLDRELGLFRVPPTVGRRIPWSRLRRAAGGDERVDEIVIGDDGTVRGAFIWWIPEDIPPLEPGAHWERWIRVAGAIDVSPLVAGYEWRRALKRGTAPHPGEVRKPDTPDRPAELSDMILFDYLTHNLDRWGSDFTNVRTRGEGGPLIFLDNAAGFFPGRHRIGLMDARLSVVQRFRRSTVEAIRSLGLDRLRQRLATDPLAPVLNEHWLEGIEVRRHHLLAHVEKMRRRFGDRVHSW